MAVTSPPFKTFIAIVLLHAAKTAKVLILGGGYAGLQAAFEMKANGVDDILLIEADDHLGGRLVSGFVDGNPVDSAFWELDPTNPDRNTNGEMLNRCNVSIRTLSLSSTVYIDDKGKDVSTEAKQRQGDVSTAIKKLIDDWNAGTLTEKNDLTLHGGLRLHGWHPKNPVDVSVEGWMLESQLPPGQQSVNYYMKLFGKDGYSKTQAWYAPGAGEHFSLRKIIKCMRDLVFTVNDERLLLNEKVMKIAYTSSGVTVTSEKGTVYQGDYAIVTFSLGVLQQDVVTFEPQLPYEKRLAINEFVMVPLTYVWVKFNTTVSFNSERFTFYLFADPQRANWNWCRDVLTDVHDVNVSYDLMRFLLVHEQALRIERQPIEQTTAELNDLLMTALGVKPERINVTAVNYNPLYYGGYRGWPAAGTSEEFDQLRAPVLNRLFFAGDAYQMPFYSRAAAISGKETADVVISCMNGQSCAYAKFAESTKATTTGCPTSGALQTSFIGVLIILSIGVLMI